MGWEEGGTEVSARRREGGGSSRVSPNSERGESVWKFGTGLTLDISRDFGGWNLRHRDECWRYVCARAPNPGEAIAITRFEIVQHEAHALC